MKINNFCLWFIFHLVHISFSTPEQHAKGMYQRLNRDTHQEILLEEFVKGCQQDPYLKKILNSSLHDEWFRLFVSTLKSSGLLYLKDEFWGNSNFCLAFFRGLFIVFLSALLIVNVSYTSFFIRTSKFDLRLNVLIQKPFWGSKRS